MNDDFLKYRVFNKDTQSYCSGLYVSQEGELLEPCEDDEPYLLNLSRYSVERSTGKRDCGEDLIYHNDVLMHITSKEKRIVDFRDGTFVLLNEYGNLVSVSWEGNQYVVVGNTHEREKEANVAVKLETSETNEILDSFEPFSDILWETFYANKNNISREVRTLVNNIVGKEFFNRVEIDCFRDLITARRKELGAADDDWSVEITIPSWWRWAERMYGLKKEDLIHVEKV